MRVQDYLDQHYWTADRLAQHSGLTVDELNGLIEASLIPKASYVVAGPVLKSAAFGDLDSQGAHEGAYFNPASCDWIARTQMLGGSEAPDALKQLFFNNMAIQLADMNDDLWRLHDSFDEEGNPRSEGLRNRIESYWNAFLEGIFGLCVCNPVSEREIARKEILQEKLTAITADGALTLDSAIDLNDLLSLVAEYEDASMPFSPVEYHLSSRKRLVDDLRRRCEALR